uniref:Omega-3 fatty acid desaturase, chloroplastic-like n=1 Tax=Nelumbo nucifera TaxID=4432 RepID=A0A822YA92_NELNU|nr:TPA_asm: hypothetical protein HUJ06_029504 [Nelumbo nucifera]
MAASWVLSECGLRPLPRVFPRPRTRVFSNNPTKIRFIACKGRGFLGTLTDVSLSPISSASRHQDWALKVSSPVRVASVDEDSGEEEKINGVDEVDEFDPGALPPFRLADVRAAIPKHCWVKDPWRSMSFVVRDVAVVFGLAAAAAYLNNWVVWPLYWAAQGTMFWALFVLGHDCGHGSFSNNPKLNSVVGHLLHSSILVPYHGWRISHRTHHQNHGHVENDESWHPVS